MREPFRRHERHVNMDDRRPADHLLQRLAALSVVALIAVACGSTVSTAVGESTPTVAPVTATMTPTTSAAPATTIAPDDPMDEQRKLLADARTRWESRDVEARSTYSFRYTLACECWQGPFDVLVDKGVAVHVDSGAGPGDAAPYLTVEDVFDEIERTLAEGRIPVRVSYDTSTGVPVEYIFNEPELPVDGGFVFVLESFDEDPVPENGDRSEAVAALAV
ncbi:MAG: DUF6174 domain-containing protein [Acidimicrobiales bacterium]